MSCCRTRLYARGVFELACLGLREKREDHDQRHHEHDRRRSDGIAESRLARREASAGSMVALRCLSEAERTALEYELVDRCIRYAASELGLR